MAAAANTTTTTTMTTAAFHSFVNINNLIISKLLPQARQIMKDAVNADREQRYVKAKDSYIAAVEILFKINQHEMELLEIKRDHDLPEMILPSTADRSTVRQRRIKIEAILNRAEAICIELRKRRPSQPQKQQHPPFPSPPAAPPPASTPPVSSPSFVLSQHIQSVESLPSFADITGLHDIKEQIRMAILIKKFPSLAQPWRTIFLYGPPGTGKSYLASAVAKEASMLSQQPYKYVSVSAADITSKWVGESEQNIQSLFQHIATIAPCVLFIDEIDSLCTTRDADSTESSRRMKTQLLVEMQSLLTSAANVMFIVASNRPYDIDSAFRRRFEIRIEILLPTIKEKKEYVHRWIVSKCGPNVIYDASLLDCMHENLNYSDLNVAFKEAVMRPFRLYCNQSSAVTLIDDATDQHMIVAAAAGSGGGGRNGHVNVTDLPDDSLVIDPQLLVLELVDVLKHMIPSVSPQDITKIHTITRAF